MRYVPRGILFLPFLIRGPKKAPRIIVIRAVFIAVIAELLLVVSVTLGIVNHRSGNFAPEIAAGIIVVAGIYGVLATQFIVSRRKLEAVPAEQLGSAYQQLFFLRIAFADATALVGFVFAFIAGTQWEVLVGLPFAAVMLAQAAPTARRIANDDFERTRLGGQGNLLNALIAPREP